MASIPSDQPLTVLIEAWVHGDNNAAESLFEMVYPELQKVAHAYINREHASGTLNTTALVNEAYIKLNQSLVSYNNRSHFFALAARVMRRILVDRARLRLADKRGAGARLATLDDGHHLSIHPNMELLDLDRAIERLAEVDPRKARIVDCIYFGGMSQEETARALGISSATLNRDLSFSRKWLERELRNAECAP